MIEFFIAFFFIIFVILVMSFGVIFSNKPIKGSCGGLQSIGLKGKCDICGETKPCDENQNEKGIIDSKDVFYDASRK